MMLVRLRLVLGLVLALGPRPRPEPGLRLGLYQSLLASVYFVLRDP